MEQARFATTCSVVTYLAPVPTAGGGGGGGHSHNTLATHPRPSTSKFNPKWHVAPCYKIASNLQSLIIVMVLRKIP